MNPSRPKVAYRHLVGTDLFFFFQAEDGIRDLIVTGVQTCALPILHGPDWRLWSADTDEEPVASRVAVRALEAGAVIGTSGEQTSLFLAPPLIISENESHQLLDALDHGLQVADQEHERHLAPSGRQ